MPFYKRGFLYLARKRAKSVLLLLIFLFVNSMILSTNMILHATERTEAAMQEKAGATVERLRMVAALAPDPVAKKLFYMLSVKLSAEGVERWYRCFYCKLRVLKNHRKDSMHALSHGKALFNHLGRCTGRKD